MFGIAGAEHSDAFAVFPWDNDRVTASNQAHEVHHLAKFLQLIVARSSIGGANLPP